MDRVRRLVVALVVLVVAGLVVLVVVVRPGLRENADDVDRSWQPLVAPLRTRYTALVALRDALNTAGVGDRDVVVALSKKLAVWSVASTGTDADEQVATANQLEALAARADALVHTPRLLQNPALGAAFTSFAKTEPEKKLLDAYNSRVMAYQDDRDGFWSRIVAHLDGYDMRPTLQLVTP
jgi:hypothetical protein